MIRPKAARLRQDPVSYKSLRQEILRRDDWRCKPCGAMAYLECITRSSVVIREQTPKRT
jgi:hypothetical protein